MAQVLNMLIGGGVPSQTAFAAISVKYKVGAVCTCSDGITTLTAPDTTGEYVFPIPYAGDWTVSFMGRSAIVSQTVTITTQYQFEVIDISEVVVVSRAVLTLDSFRSASNMAYFDGLGSSSITSQGTDYFRLYTGSTSSYRQWIRKVGINLDNFSTLKVVGYGTAGNTFVGLSTKTTGVENVASVTIGGHSDDVTETVDITSLTGTHYVYFRGLMSYIWIRSVSFMR